MAHRHYDERLAGILAEGARLFALKGFRGASMRDLSEATGLSLAGLYYYFDSKDRLLFMILKDVFERVLAAGEASLEGKTDPAERIRALVGSHVDYFLDHIHRMKVLSHEAENLTGEMATGIRSLQRRYYQLIRREVDALRDAGRTRREVHPHGAVMALFGMMNWLYTWYDPARGDLGRQALKDTLSSIFLHGLLSS